MRQKLTIIFSFVFAIFFSVHVNADIIEVSKSQKIEISDFKFEGKGNILSTTDSWKISVSLTNIIPSEVDYCRISAYPHWVKQRQMILIFL